MKIKRSFVTNSSSTCFVIVSKKNFTLPEFLREIGLDEKSPFQDVFERLFEKFKNDIHPARKYYENQKGENNEESFENFILRIFSQKTLDKILDAEKKGYTIYMGDLYSDDDIVEAFFCTSCFIIDTENLFVDATDDAW